jgi:inner membrane protein
MDPLTHTLVGAALAQTRFGRVPLGTATLIVGANLPDIDAATYLVGGDVALWVRRGWTHGVLAMAVLPALLGWAMHHVDLARCRRNPTATPVPIRRLMALSYLSVLSHPAMDWLNTYGVRLLMPFSGRWFYGDSLFIVDPWVWLALGTVAILAYSHTRIGAVRCLVVGGIGTLLVTGFPGLPAGIKLFWLASVGAIAVVRVRGGFRQALPRVATVCLIGTGLYVAAMAASSLLARGQVVEWARDRQLEPRRIMMGPAPGNPFRKSVILGDDQHYHRLTFDWLGRERITPVGPEIPIGDDHPAARAALAVPAVRGLATWTRLPVFEVAPSGNGYRVRVGDLRFGNVTVELDRELRPR